MALSFFLTEAAHGWVISSFANMVPSLLYAALWAVLEGLVDSVCEEYTSIWDLGPSYFDAWTSFLLGIMDSFGSEMHLATNQRMVSVTVGAVTAAGDEETAQQWYSIDDEIQLVPMTRSWVSPGYSVDRLGGENCICYTQIVVWS